MKHNEGGTPQPPEYVAIKKDELAQLQARILQLENELRGKQ